MEDNIETLKYHLKTKEEMIGLKEEMISLMDKRIKDLEDQLKKSMSITDRLLQLTSGMSVSGKRNYKIDQILGSEEV